jgi:hypothetical protein
MLRELEAEGQSALVAAIDLLVEPEPVRVKERLESLLEKAGETTRLSIVAFTLRRLGPEFEPFANRVFDELLAPEAPPHARRAAVRALALLPAGAAPHGLLGQAVHDPDPTVASAAVDTAGRLFREDLLPAVVGQLGRPRVRADIRRCLTRFGEGALPSLQQAMTDESLPAAARRQIPALLAEVGTAAAFSSLISGLEGEDPGLREQCIRALYRVRRRNPDYSPLYGRRLQEQLMSHAKGHRDLLNVESALRSAGGLPAEPLAWLCEAVENERCRMLDSMFMLMALEHPPRDVGRSWLAFKSGSLRERANAIELLDSMLPKLLKRELLPLLEIRGGGAGSYSSEETIRRLAAGPDAWLAACAFYTARESGIGGLEEQARRAAASDESALREEAVAFLGATSREIDT